MALKIITIDAAVETSALDAGDVVNNAILTFPLSGYAGTKIGKVLALAIADPDANTGANLAGEFWLFNATVTQAAADAAHAISDSDLKKCFGVIKIASTDISLETTGSFVYKAVDPPMYFKVDGSHGTPPATTGETLGLSLFAIYRVTATPTFAGGTLQFSLTVEVDA